MKQLPSSAAWVFMLLGLTLTGCATTPPPPDLEASHLDKKLKALCTPVIYMTLWVDSENRLVFDRGELKQLVLFFVS